MENKNYVVAIDLGTSNVAVVVGSRGDDSKVHIEDFVIHEMQGVSHGEIKNIEQASKAIKEAVEEIEGRMGIKITEACAGISGEHIQCAKNSYYVYVGSDGEIGEADVQRLTDSMRNVQAPEGKKILHIIPQNYIVNDREEVVNPVGMFGQKLEATFTFILDENQILQRHEKALARLGIRQNRMFLNALVSSEAVALPDEKEIGVAVVDIGAGTVDVSIYYDNIVRYVGVIPMGAEAINRDIRAYGILERYVEELKVKHGSAVSENASAEKIIRVPGRTPRDPKEISFRNLASIIEARMLDIADYVMEEIKNSGYEGRLAAGLVLTGGGAMLKDLDVLFKNHTGMDVRIASAEVSVDDESADAALDPRLSTAIGILMKGFGQGRQSRVEKAPLRRAAEPHAQPQKLREEEPRQQAPLAAAYGTPPVQEPAERQQQAAGADIDEVDEIFGSEDDGRKRGFFTKVIDYFNKKFDVIDDNEI